MADPPADPLAALLARPVDEKVFERNASADPRWLTDRRALFAADLPGDARLVARLARKGPAWNRSWGPDRVAAVLRGAEGDACWPIAPLTLWRGPHMDLLRWGLGPGRPAVDLSADYLRLALACLGGADAVTWNGDVPGGLVTLWRGGRAAAVLGPARAAERAKA